MGRGGGSTWLRFSSAVRFIGSCDPSRCGDPKGGILRVSSAMGFILALPCSPVGLPANSCEPEAVGIAMPYIVRGWIPVVSTTQESGVSREFQRRPESRLDSASGASVAAPDDLTGTVSVPLDNVKPSRRGPASPGFPTCGETGTPTGASTFPVAEPPPVALALSQRPRLSSTPTMR